MQLVVFQRENVRNPAVQEIHFLKQLFQNFSDVSINAQRTIRDIPWTVRLSLIDTDVERLRILCGVLPERKLDYHRGI